MAEIELGCPYQIYPPDQSTYAAFNDPANANFVGYVTDITGLDDAEVRENAQNNVAGDSGYNGPFWRGRRPWTMSGIVMPTTPIAARSAASRKIQWIMAQCMRKDGYLAWTPNDGVRRLILFRKQQPVRITTGQSNVQKNFQIAGVSADWRIIAATTKVVSTFNSPWTLTTTNSGDATSSPYITLTGPINAPVITNTTTGKKFTFAAFSSVMIPVGYTMAINLSTQYPTILRADGYDFSGYIDISNTDYTIGPEPGAPNNWTLTGANMVDGQTGFSIQWNDAYV